MSQDELQRHQKERGLMIKKGMNQYSKLLIENPGHITGFIPLGEMRQDPREKMTVPDEKGSRNLL